MEKVTKLFYHYFDYNALFHEYILCVYYYRFGDLLNFYIYCACFDRRQLICQKIPPLIIGLALGLYIGPLFTAEFYVWISFRNLFAKRMFSKIYLEKSIDQEGDS